MRVTAVRMSSDGFGRRLTASLAALAVAGGALFGVLVSDGIVPNSTKVNAGVTVSE